MRPEGRTTREQFIGRVRRVLAQGSGNQAPAPPPAPNLVRLVDASTPRVPLFTERARAVGMHVHPTSLAAMHATIRAVLDASSCAGIAASIEDTTLQSAAAFSTIDWRTGPPLEPLYDTDAGITDTLAAIAESGSLVVASSPRTSRGGFLVPPIHVALLRASKILPDLVDLPALLAPTPTSAVIITGPSKTADIEGILITGVHGPKEVHIILITDA